METIQRFTCLVSARFESELFSRVWQNWRYDIRDNTLYTTCTIYDTNKCRNTRRARRRSPIPKWVAYRVPGRAYTQCVLSRVAKHNLALLLRLWLRPAVPDSLRKHETPKENRRSYDGHTRTWAKSVPTTTHTHYPIDMVYVVYLVECAESRSRAKIHRQTPQCSLPYPHKCGVVIVFVRSSSSVWVTNSVGLSWILRLLLYMKSICSLSLIFRLANIEYGL